MSPYVSLLTCTENTRDLGNYPNGLGQFTVPMRFLRSDRPGIPALNDIQFLQKNSIQTVIDLRDVCSVNEVRSGLEGISGIHYIQAPVSDKALFPASSDQVVPGYLRAAHSTGMMNALYAMATATGGVLFHCSAGKDRTGILAAILLKLCDVPEHMIIKDYCQTGRYLMHRFARLARRSPDTDLNTILPQPEYMEGFLDAMGQKYTSCNEYLQKMGLSSSEIVTLRSRLLDP